MTTDETAQPGVSPRRAKVEVAVCAGLCLAAFGAKLVFAVPASVWSSAVDLCWQVPLFATLWHLGKARGESLDLYSEALTRSAVWDLVLLFVAGSAVYAATHRLLGGLVPCLLDSVWHASPRVLRGAGALPALALSVAGPLLSEALLRGLLQTRLRQLRWPAAFIVLTSAGLQAMTSFERGLLPMIAMGAQFLVFAAYYHRSRRLWPVMIAHAMQSGIGLAALSRHVF